MDVNEDAPIMAGPPQHTEMVLPIRLRNPMHPLGLFGKLPRELRDIVYRLVLADCYFEESHYRTTIDDEEVLEHNATLRADAIRLVADTTSDSTRILRRGLRMAQPLPNLLAITRTCKEMAQEVIKELFTGHFKVFSLLPRWDRGSGSLLTNQATAHNLGHIINFATRESFKFNVVLCAWIQNLQTWFTRLDISKSLSADMFRDLCQFEVVYDRWSFELRSLHREMTQLQAVCHNLGVKPIFVLHLRWQFDLQPGPILEEMGSMCGNGPLEILLDQTSPGWMRYSVDCAFSAIKDSMLWYSMMWDGGDFQEKRMQRALAWREVGRFLTALEGSANWSWSREDPDPSSDEDDEDSDDDDEFADFDDDDVPQCHWLANFQACNCDDGMVARLCQIHWASSAWQFPPRRSTTSLSTLTE